MQELLDQAFYYLDALWRRRWIALGAAFLIACGGWAYVAQMPNEYRAEAKVHVDTASVLNPLLEGLTVNTDIAQQIAVMRQTLLTRPTLEEVIRKTDLDLTVKTEAGAAELVESVRQRIRIEANSNNIFTIAFNDTEPARAAAVVDTLTTMFVQNNLGEDRRDMQTAQGFLDRQIQKYENQLNAAEARLAEFKQEHRELLPGQSGLREDLEAAEAGLAEINAQINDARTRKAFLEEQLAETPEMLTQQGGQAGPPSNVEVQIMEVEGRLDELKARYTDRHPDVKAAERRLTRLREELQAQQSAVAGPGVGPGPAGGAAGSGPGPGADSGGIKIPNPSYSQLRMSYIDVQSQIQTLQQKRARQQQTVATLQGRLERVPEVETQLKKLTRNLGMIRSRYDALLSRRETAELASAREAESDKVQFRIIEPAQVPVVPEGPNRPMFMAAVLVMSLGAGTGGATLLALMKTSYGSVNHLRRDFDLPVIGAVSALPSAHARLRRLLEGTGLALAGTAFLGLFGALVLLERQVGLPTLVEGPLTPAALGEALGNAIQGITGGPSA